MIQMIEKDCEKCGNHEYVGSCPNGDTSENAGHVSIVLNNKTDKDTTVPLRSTWSGTLGVRRNICAPIVRRHSPNLHLAICRRKA